MLRSPIQALGFSTLVLASSLACGKQPASRQVNSPQPRFAVDAPAPGGASATLSGEVLGVDNRSANSENQRTLSIQLRANTKKPVTVHLGPGWYFTEHGIEFHRNDIVVIAGTPGEVDGQEVIIAHEVEKDGVIYERPAGDPNAPWHIKQPPAAADAETSSPPATEPQQSAPATGAADGTDPAAETTPALNQPTTEPE